MGELHVSRDVEAKIPTKWGIFDLVLFRNNLDAKENLAFVLGDVRKGVDILTRVHSECFTGDVLGSLRCDCGEQLERSLSMIGHARRGVLLYLRQEGRGIGLPDKLRAYNLQDEGLDTVEANLRLGHRPDERDYRVAALMLGDLGIRTVNLITNNPAKISELKRLGVGVSSRTPIEIPARPENAGYLRTKLDRMDHLLGLGGHLQYSEDQF
jgi:3,4-dihydroxy 2-butanone 4-phosphate synthase/GTP cyclohydrolase II